MSLNPKKGFQFVRAASSSRKGNNLTVSSPPMAAKIARTSGSRKALFRSSAGALMLMSLLWHDGSTWTRKPSASNLATPWSNTEGKICGAEDEVDTTTTLSSRIKRTPSPRSQLRAMLKARL